MKDVLSLLKGRRTELKTELNQVERAIAALEPRPTVPRAPVTESARRNMSEAQLRRHRGTAAQAGLPESDVSGTRQ